MSDHEARIVNLETRMTSAEARLDDHAVIISRVDQIYDYVRNTWIVVKWGGSAAGAVAAIAGALRVFGVI